MITGAAVAALAACALAGCGYPGAEADREAAAGQQGSSTAQSTTGSTAAGSATPTTSGSASPSSTSSPGDQEDESALPTLDLGPESESATQYMYAVQAFSPLLESWEVDKDAGTLRYVRYTCAGTVDAEGSGTLEQVKGDVWKVTWGGESPMRLSSSDHERLEITDSVLVYGTERSSTDTDTVTSSYVGKCEEAGEAVAGFVP